VAGDRAPHIAIGYGPKVVVVGANGVKLWVLDEAENTVCLAAKPVESVWRPDRDGDDDKFRSLGPNGANRGERRGTRRHAVVDEDRSLTA
jgi:hypothetical protein